jgi:hypothetical protein
MTEATRAETARKVFAAITESLEDSSVVASEGQVTPNLTSARHAADRLIVLLEAFLARLQRLRRRLG